MAHQSSLAAVLEHDLMEVGICDLATFLLMLEHDAAEVFNVIMRNDECRAAALRACQPEQATAACQWESPWEKIKEEEEVSTQHGTQTTEEIINLCTAAVTVENITQTTEELVEVVVAARPLWPRQCKLAMSSQQKKLLHAEHSLISKLSVLQLACGDPR